MKSGLLISLAIATLVAVGLFSCSQIESKHSSLITLEEANSFTSFTLWSAKYGKQYSHDDEKSYRFKRYLENAKIVKEHNARYAQGLETFDLELNHFADMDIVEFSSIHLGLKKNVGITKQCTGSVKHVDNPPAEWDWLAKGAVGHVANQGNCGSCWAFSAIGALEGLGFIEKGKLWSLSQQQLVDCSTKKEYGNEGCNGGEMDAAFWYVIDHGITEASTYPYTARTQTCKYADSQAVYRIQNCAEVTPNKTAALIDAVLAQPVSISVEADQSSFQLYKSGVFSGNCGHNLDHGVF